MPPRFTPSSLSIIGFGAFGQLAAGHLRRRLPVCICDPVPHASDLPQVDLVGAAACDIVILAVPLSQLRGVLTGIAPHLRPGALVVDVTSVKVEPARLMQQILPAHVEIVASHPLFGPQSARDGIAGQRIAWCPLRGRRHWRLAAVLRQMGLRVVLTTPDQHDREMAVVQALTHLVAHGLTQFQPLPRRLTTASFRLLVEAAGMVAQDSPELLQTILTCNPYAAEVEQRFLQAAARRAGMVAG